MIFCRIILVSIVLVDVYTGDTKKTIGFIGREIRELIFRTVTIPTIPRTFGRYNTKQTIPFYPKSQYSLSIFSS